MIGAKDEYARRPIVQARIVRRILSLAGIGEPLLGFGRHWIGVDRTDEREAQNCG